MLGFIFALAFLFWILLYFLLIFGAKLYCGVTGREWKEPSMAIKIIVFIAAPFCYPPTWLWLFAFMIS